MNLNISAAKFAAALIEGQLGGLADFPSDVADTVSNCYYKFALHVETGEARSGGHRRSPDVNDAGEGPNCAMMPDLIAELRRLRVESDRTIYEYATELFLDQFKYKINNVMNKSGAQRRIERKISRVDEIPGMYQLLLQISSHDPKSSGTTRAGAGASPTTHLNLNGDKHSTTNVSKIVEAAKLGAIVFVVVIIFLFFNLLAMLAMR